MAQVEAVIAVSDGRKRPRKLVKIQASRDGSIGVMVPYHEAKIGSLAKVELPSDNLSTPDGTRFAEIVESYRVSTPIKLSIHASGFVQFSAAGRARVRSGMAAPFHIPKGLGLHSLPILDPVDTGPVFGVAFDDTSACAELDQVRRGTKLLTFEEGTFFERDEHDAISRHAYTVEGRLFPGSMRRSAVYDRGWVLDEGYSVRRPEWRVRWRVLDLPTPVAFLGIVVSRTHIPTTAGSGYRLSSPKDRTQRFVLIASYPAGDEDAPESFGLADPHESMGQ